MSEQITHLAVADDTRRLALASPRIAEPIRQVLRDHPQRMRLGAITRGTETFAGPLVRTLRDRRDAPRQDDDEKLAFVLGTLAHRAADRMMKPIFRSQSADGACEPKDISICHDIFLFDRLYGRGTREPYRPDALDPTVALPRAPDLDAAALESYFQVLLQRTLLQAHTFIPDYSDPERWMEELFKRLQRMVLDIRRYHRALTDPDPAIVRRAIVDVNFYNDDRLLGLLRDLRAGRDVDGEEFLRRCVLGDGDSLYARAVSMAYGYVQVVSEYWMERASEELLRDAIRR